MEGVSVSGVGRQFIAFQRDMWELSLYDSKLHLDINGIRLEAPAPPSGACTSVVVTSQFNPGNVMPKTKSSLVELYVNGEKAAEFSAKSFMDPLYCFVQNIKNTNPAHIRWWFDLCNIGKRGEIVQISYNFIGYRSRLNFSRPANNK